MGLYLETGPLKRCVCTRSATSDSVRPRGLQPARLLCPRILQARILSGVAMPFSRGSSQPRDQTLVSYISRWVLYQLSHWGSAKIRFLGGFIIALKSSTDTITPYCLHLVRTAATTHSWHTTA